MYFIFDTETAGLPKDWKAPVTNLKNWPRVIQLAWSLHDKDGKMIDSQEDIIKPVGFKIDPKAAKVHGITNEIAAAKGVALEGVLARFVEAVGKSKHLVAHNISFDYHIMGAELLRAKQSNIMAKMDQICTMKETVGFCQLPGKYGFKWPTLTELHLKVFGKNFEGAHTAMADVRACADCFFELRKKKVL